MYRQTLHHLYINHHTSGVAGDCFGGRVAGTEGAWHIRGVRGHAPPENFEI